MCWEIKLYSNTGEHKKRHSINFFFGGGCQRNLTEGNLERYIGICQELWRIWDFHPTCELTSEPITIPWISAEDISPLGQRQRILLLTAQYAAWGLCLHWFPLRPEAYGDEVNGPGRSCLQWVYGTAEGPWDLETQFFHEGAASKPAPFLPWRKTLSLLYWPGK